MEKFTKAWDKINQRPIDVSELPKSRNGLNCQCSCVECGQNLEACQGEKRAWYFRHTSQSECKGGPMTALHLTAQHLLLDTKTIETKEGRVTYTNGAIEFLLPESSYRADVVGNKSNGEKFVIEIRVTHEIEESKLNFLREQKMHSIEIDLSKIDPDISKDDLLRMLLTDVSKQKIIYSSLQKEELTTPDIKPDELSWFAKSFIVFVVFLIGYQIVKCVKVK